MEQSVVIDAKAGPAGPGLASGRDRYLDLLRALALSRVVLYHSFSTWGWLTFAFPSMGVMFVLAGSLMARSLERPAAGVLLSRVRRLLPPLWLYGAVIACMMLIQGWHPQRPLDWDRLLFWVLPVSDPPVPAEIGAEEGLADTAWAAEAGGILWYLRAYLWFVLLSPLMLRFYRRFGLPVLLAPLAVVAAIGTGLLDIPGRAGDAITDFATYGACWLLGFACQDGRLKRLSWRTVIVAALLLMGTGLWWAVGHPGPEGLDLGDIPLAQALWSLGYCLVLFRLSPSWAALPARLRLVDGLVTLANNRAMTIYLWHELALLGTIPLIDLLWSLPPLERGIPWLLDSEFLNFVLVWPLLAVAVLTFGWMEDLAARRRPRLWPDKPAAPVHRGVR